MRKIIALLSLSAITAPANALADENTEENVSTPVVEKVPETETSTAKSAPVADEKKETTNPDPDWEEDEKSWHVGATVGFRAGSGSFMTRKYDRRVRLRYGVDLYADYKIPVIDTVVTLSTGFSQWLSKAGGTNGKHEFRWQDSSLQFSRSIYAYTGNEWGVAFRGALGFTLPTSKASYKVAKLYTAISPSLGFSIYLDRISLSYTAAYTHNFNRHTSASFDASDVDILSRKGGNELLADDLIAEGGVLNQMTLANNFSVNYAFVKGIFSATVAFAFSDSWTYDNGTVTKKDDYVGKYAKVGRGRSQRMAGRVSLNYTPIRFFGMNLFMQSSQPWKDASNGDYLFPFFDAVTPNKNYTYFGLNLWARY